MDKNGDATINQGISAALISEKYLDNKDSNSLGKKQEKEFKDSITRDGENRHLSGENLDRFKDNIYEKVQKLDQIRFK